MGMGMNSSGNVISILLLLAMGVGIFSYMMRTDPNPDEEMQISASVLSQNHTIYKDFAFLQMPYLPLAYGLIYKVLNTTYYLLIKRLFDIFFMSVSAWLIFRISYSICQSNIVSASLLLFYVLNNTTLYTMGYGANSIMPVPFCLSGFYLFIKSSSQNKMWSGGIFFSGILLAIACGIHSFYLSALPPFLLICLFYPISRPLGNRLYRGVLPLIAGIFLGLSPAIYYYYSYPDAFTFNTYEIHALNKSWYQMTHYVQEMTLNSKLHFILNTLAHPTSLVLPICAFLIFVTLLFDRENLNMNSSRRFILIFQKESLFTMMLLVLTIGVVLIQQPPRIQHLALAIPFLILLISYWYKMLSEDVRNYIHILLISLASLCIITGGKPIFQHIYQIHDVQHWRSISLHRTAVQMKAFVNVDYNDFKIATLSPLYALEAGLRIYPELSTGPLLYRVGDLVPDEKLSLYKGTSRERIYWLFQRKYPGAILVDQNTQNNLVQPFVQFATVNGFKQLPWTFDGLSLYVGEEY
ncbi:hypothetical protein JXJ21_13110 [candidate division KSB1 bacterium]|nr:hypothetical protein [candidate division KSB1 bacterium]